MAQQQQGGGGASASTQDQPQGGTDTGEAFSQFLEGLGDRLAAVVRNSIQSTQPAQAAPSGRPGTSASQAAPAAGREAATPRPSRDPVGDFLAQSTRHHQETLAELEAIQGSLNIRRGMILAEQEADARYRQRVLELGGAAVPPPPAPSDGNGGDTNPTQPQPTPGTPGQPAPSGPVTREEFDALAARVDGTERVVVDLAGQMERRLRRYKPSTDVEKLLKGMESDEGEGASKEGASGQEEK